MFVSSAPASSSTVPSIAGTWNVQSTGGPSTWTFVQTGPNLYTFSNGVGWWTTNVPISGNSSSATMVLWECGEGGTFSQADEAACPSTSGHCTDNFQFTFPKTGNETLTGQYSCTGATPGTQTGTGPPVPVQALSVDLRPGDSVVLVGDTIRVDVKVTAGAAEVTGIGLGSGLESSGEAAVTVRPGGLRGFDLAAGASRTFAFEIKGEKPGRASLRADVTGSSAGQTVSDSAAAVVTVIGAYKFTLTGFEPGRQDNDDESDTNLFVGSKADYLLQGWKPAGGPVDVYADGKLVKSFPAPATADAGQTGEYAINNWVTRGTVHDPKSCDTKLVAKQGDISRDLTLVGDPVGVIVYADNTTGTLKSGDLYCSGEYTLHPDDFHAKATGAIVYTYPTGGFNLGLADFVLTIDDNQRNIHGVGFYVAATSLACVRLDGDRWLTISGGPDSLASTSIGTRPCPPRDNPPLIAGFERWNPVPIDTNYRLDSPHDVCLNKNHTGPYIFRDHTTFTEHVDCNAVLLYGEGDLSFSHGIKGQCTVVAADSLEIVGPIDLTGPLDLASPPGSSVLVGAVKVVANNELILWGE